MMSPASLKLSISSAFTCSWTWFSSYLNRLNNFGSNFLLKLLNFLPWFDSSWVNDLVRLWITTERQRCIRSLTTKHILVEVRCEFLFYEHVFWCQNIWYLTDGQSKSYKIVYVPSDHKICFILHGNEELFTVIFFIGIYVLTEKHMTDSCKKSPDSLQNVIIKCFMSLIDGCDDKKDLFSICAFAENVTIPYSRTLFISHNKFRII